MRVRAGVSTGRRACGRDSRRRVIVQGRRRAGQPRTRHPQVLCLAARRFWEKENEEANRTPPEGDADALADKLKKNGAVLAVLARASGCLLASKAALRVPECIACVQEAPEGPRREQPVATSAPGRDSPSKSLRGGFSDGEYSDADDEEEDEDFEAEEDDSEVLRQIGAELDRSAKTGSSPSSEGTRGESEEDIIRMLKDMTDASKRSEPYPWEGMSTKWMSDPKVSVVLPPEDRDGHQYLLEVKRNKLGEELSGTLDIDLKKGKKLNVEELKRKYKNKLLVQTSFRPDRLRDMTYSQFWSLVGERQIQKVRFSYDKRNLIVTTKATAPGGQRTEKIGLAPDPQLMDHLTTHGVFVEEPRDLSVVEDLILGLLRLGIPISVGIALLYSCTKIGMLAEDKTSSFEVINPHEIGYSFKDVAGIEVIKDEVQEVVTFLRYPKRFLEMGIRTPAGVLLVGNPGTGKTLLARAVATEANVPLINCSGSEFVDEYVGMGAAKIRDLFELAREKAPCVIFIDEFDGLGKARTGGSGSEEMHTCNQLLAEMDGFTNNTGVVVLAATNRAFVLDKAVLRPGRFDRLLEMPLPDRKGRLDILGVHSKGKVYEKNVDLSMIAKATPGFTGAELMNLLNQSGLHAIRKGRETISQEDIFESLDEIQSERVGESSPFTARQLDGTPPAQLRKRMAVFAAAKGLIGCIMPEYHELARVSVSPSGHTSTFAHYIPKEESVETNVVDRAVLESELVVFMAGYCAEKLTFGENNVSILGSSDYQSARVLAEQIVCEYGFGRNVRLLSIPHESAPEDSVVEEATSTSSDKVSATMNAAIRADVTDLLNAAEAKAYIGLARNWRLYEKLANELFVNQHIMGQEFVSMLKENGAFMYPDQYLKDFYEDAGSDHVVYPDHTDAQDFMSDTEGSNGAAVAAEESHIVQQ